MSKKIKVNDNHSKTKNNEEGKIVKKEKNHIKKEKDEEEKKEDEKNEKTKSNNLLIKKGSNLFDTSNIHENVTNFFYHDLCEEKNNIITSEQDSLIEKNPQEPQEDKKDLIAIFENGATASSNKLNLSRKREKNVNECKKLKKNK